MYGYIEEDGVITLYPEDLPDTARPTSFNSSIDVIGERERTHGNFLLTGAVAHGIKDAFRRGPNWPDLNPMQKEALDMLASKIGRILSGDPDFHDHWLDGSAYLMLVADSLKEGIGDDFISC